MQALLYTAEFCPREGIELSDRDRAEKRSRDNSDQVFKHPKAEIVELPKPSIQSPHDVLIKVMRSAICGADLLALGSGPDGYVANPRHLRSRQVLGHEFSGVVEEVGSEVESLAPGDMVAAESRLWCGRCNNCAAGFPNQCLNLEELGLSTDGCHGEYIVVPVQYCYNIGEFLNVYGDPQQAFEAGALCEPSAVTFNAIFECSGGFRPGAYVVVFGIGLVENERPQPVPIDLLGIAQCKAAGAAKIILVEKNQERINMARDMGADYVINPNELNGNEIHEAIMEITSGLGSDFFMEVSGLTEKYFPDIEKSLALGAKVVVCTIGEERIPIDLAPYNFRKAKISASLGHVGYGTFRNVIRLISGGRFDPTKVITGRYLFQDIQKALHSAADVESGREIVQFD